MSDKMSNKGESNSENESPEKNCEHMLNGNAKSPSKPKVICCLMRGRRYTFVEKN